MGRIRPAANAGGPTESALAVAAGLSWLSAGCFSFVVD